jgi:hypothetical protein
VAGVQRLPKEWLVGWDCEIGGPRGRPVRVALVALHPELGIALLEGATWTEGADDTLRERLVEARFGALFGGLPPILHGTFEQGELPRLVPVLTDAFGGLPALDLAGDGAWVATATRLIVPRDRCWTDNLEGAPRAAPSWPPHGRPGSVGPGWRGGPPDVVPLRRAAGGARAEAAGPEQTPPLPAPQTRRAWPRAVWAGACALAVALATAAQWRDPSPTAEPVTIAALAAAEDGAEEAPGSARPSGGTALPEETAPAAGPVAAVSSSPPPPPPAPLPPPPPAASPPPLRRAEPSAPSAARVAQRGETRLRAAAPSQKPARPGGDAADSRAGRRVPG